MSNYFKIVFFVLFLVATVGLFLFFWQYSYFQNYFTNHKNIFIFEPQLNEWIPSKEKPLTTIDDLVAAKNPNDDGFHNYAILRGYFDHYDQESNLLYMKNSLPLSNLYELAALHMSPYQTVYCAASTYTNKDGEIFYTQKSRFPVKDGATLYTIKEKEIDLTDFLNLATQQTYLFIQLTDIYSSSKDNYIYKLVAVGICN